jgi:hypothetical protein
MCRQIPPAANEAAGWSSRADKPLPIEERPPNGGEWREACQDVSGGSVRASRKRRLHELDASAKGDVGDKGRNREQSVERDRHD